MVCVDFSLIGSDPKVSHLLAEIAMFIADGKGLWQWGGGLKTESTGYREEKYSL